MAVWNQTTPEESKDKSPATPASPAQSTPILTPTAAKNRSESIFGAGVTIEGKIEGDADVRIAGKFKGEIQVKGDLNIEKGAHLTAKVSAANVTIGGELDGNVVASAQVKLLESGQLLGDLKASTLTVAAGSRMRGHVEFGWNASDVAKFVNGHAHDNDKNRPGDENRPRNDRG
jgi:cytoskeletal protein CcmA (bactofilin family)